MCEDCGQEFTVKEGLRWHVEKCQKRRKICHDSRRLTPASKTNMSKVEPPLKTVIKTKDICPPNFVFEKSTNIEQTNIVSEHCPKCDQKIEAIDIDTLLAHMIKHNSKCKNKCENELASTNVRFVKSVDMRGPFELKQHKRDAHRDLSASVTPPPKKQKDLENIDDKEVELVIKEMTNLSVDQVCKVPKNNKIPNRFEKLLRIKGYDINDHIIQRVGGGGRCGVNCVSIHTTGNERQAKEIRINTNEHILENWENIYKDSYEFPYIERVGNGSKTFANEDEFLDFLLHKEEEASTLWMTHADMQAVSTMLNMKINILTTGIIPPNTYRCDRCKPGQQYSNDGELVQHTQNVHKRFESEEEKEGKLQRA